MIAIIPMAGKGERFVKAGYTIPKPLLTINTIPMVVKAALDLPKADEYIFIALQKHLTKFKLDVAIKAHLPQAKFIVLDKLTAGQASTCSLALDSVDAHEGSLIGACDNGMIFDQTQFEQLKQTADVIVFTFRHNVTVVAKPEQYGWVKLSPEGLVASVSVKKPISEQPQNDHAIVGAFWFRQSQIFDQAAKKMIAEDRRINHEFYVDECINDAIDLGYRVAVLEIDNYICWGTPNDYQTFNYWKTFYELTPVCYQ